MIDDVLFSSQDTTQDQLSDMASWKNSKLMTFDSQNAHVKTHFNDQLVVLLREVRQLQSLGFPIKRDVLIEVETANKFYRSVNLLRFEQSVGNTSLDVFLL